MALSEDALRAMRNESSISRQMLTELRAMRQSMQASADLARRFSQAAARQQQQASHNRPMSTNRPLMSTTSAHAAAMISGGQTRDTNKPGENTVTQLASQQRVGGSAQQGTQEGAQEGGQEGTQAGPQGSEGDEGTNTAQNTPQAGPGGSGDGSGGGSDVGVGGNSSSPEGGATGESEGGGGAGILGRIPVVGGLIANSPIAKVGGWLGSQRDKDDYYRSIEGGSHANAVKERATEEVNRWKYALHMTGEESRAAFKDITRLGFTDEDVPGYKRSDLMTYVGQAKSRRGQSESESIGQLQSWLNNGSQSLKEFQQALDSISDTARKAGVNTQMARSQFQSFFNLATSMGGGPGSAAISKAFTESNLSTGRVTSKQLHSEDTQTLGFESRAAAMSGMTPGEFQIAKRHGKKSYFQAVRKAQRVGIDQIIPQDLQEWAKQYHSEHPDVTLETAGVAFMDHIDRTHPEFWDQTRMQGLAQLTGQSADNPDAMMRWVYARIVGIDKGPRKPKKGEGGDNGKSGKGGKGDDGKSPMTQYLTHGGGGDKKKGDDKPSYNLLGDFDDDKKGDKDGKVEGHLSLSPGVKKYIEQQNAKKKPTHKGAHDGQRSAHHDEQQDGLPSGLHPIQFNKKVAGGQQQVKVKLDATPDAKRLIKAMVVTGGDPYSGAHSASSGRPHPHSGNPTR